MDAVLPVRLTNPLAQDVTVEMALEPDRGDLWTMFPADLQTTLAPYSSQEMSIQFSHPGSEEYSAGENRRREGHRCCHAPPGASLASSRT